MQIFRPFESHAQTAQFLDDVRLNKQIVEAYQIAILCLKRMELVPAEKMGYNHHPMVDFIFNQEKPYIPDLMIYIKVLNDEWINRGFKRSPDFIDKLNKINQLILDNLSRFSLGKMPPYYLYGGVVDTTTNAYQMYQDLLYQKWSQDKIKVKVTLKKPRGDKSLGFMYAVEVDSKVSIT